MLNKCTILCLATIVAFSSELENVPDYIHVCRKNDPKLVECIIQSIERLRPGLMKGIPELDIPSIEPLQLGDLLVSESTTSNGLTITAKDIRAFGPSDFKVKKLTITRFGEEYIFDIFLPQLYVDGTYNINGQVLLFPIKGSGRFTGNFTSCTGIVKATLPKRSSNDENVSISKIDIKIKVGNGNLKLKNLFNGDKVLGEAINDVINQNFELLSKDIIPLVERALQRTFKKIANKICNRYTYTQLFPLT